MKYIFIALIDFYRVCISPLLGPNKCRFYPTCSAYCKESVQRFGAIKGIYLGVKRILRCNPWNSGGYDPVPVIFPTKKGER